MLNVGSSSAPPGSCPHPGSGSGSAGMNLERSRTGNKGQNVRGVGICTSVRPSAVALPLFFKSKLGKFTFLYDGSVSTFL